MTDRVGSIGRDDAIECTRPVPVPQPLFAFGTLMDPDVLALVCDVSPDSYRTEAAFVENSARRWVIDDHYPVLVSMPGETLAGYLIHDLDEHALARIAFFEGEEFVLSPTTVRRVADDAPIDAQYFAHTGRKPFADMSWELADWQSTTKADTLPRVRRYMACFGKMSVAEADAFW